MPEGNTGGTSVGPVTGNTGGTSVSSGNTGGTSVSGSGTGSVTMMSGDAGGGMVAVPQSLGVPLASTERVPGGSIFDAIGGHEADIDSIKVELRNIRRRLV
jgi:hypothetical protein